MLKKKILVIDDEEDLGNLITLLFRKDPFDISFANTLFKATESIHIGVPDIIILDNNLPDGLGLNFFKLHKTLLSQTFVIFMTADSTSSLQEEAITAGVNYCLSKPFDVWSLRNMIVKETSSYSL